jgi:hypothetical protein
MKKVKSLIAILALSGAFSAQAIPIDLGTQNGAPADQGSRLNRLNTQIDIYNAANNPDLPDAVLAGSFESGSQTGTTISIDVTGWTYLVLKWSNNDRYWYVGGDTGVISFPSTSFNQNNQPQDLSGYSLFNPTSRVPDAGTTLVLLGGSLIGLGALRRRFSK